MSGIYFSLDAILLSKMLRLGRNSVYDEVVK